MQEASQLGHGDVGTAKSAPADEQGLGVTDTWNGPPPTVAVPAAVTRAARPESREPRYMATTLPAPAGTSQVDQAGARLG